MTRPRRVETARREIGLYRIKCLAWWDSVWFSSLKVVYSAQIHETESSAYEDCALQHSTLHPSPPPRSSLYIRLGFVRHARTLCGNRKWSRRQKYDDISPVRDNARKKSVFTYFLCGRKKRSKMSRPRFLSLFPPVSRPSQTYLKFDQKENGTVPFEFFPPLTAFEHSSAPCPRVSLMAPSRVL